MSVVSEKQSGATLFFHGAAKPPMDTRSAWAVEHAKHVTHTLFIAMAHHNTLALHVLLFYCRVRMSPWYKKHLFEEKG